MLYRRQLDFLEDVSPLILEVSSAIRLLNCVGVSLCCIRAKVLYLIKLISFNVSLTQKTQIPVTGKMLNICLYNRPGQQPVYLQSVQPIVLPPGPNRKSPDTALKLALTKPYMILIPC